MLSPRHVLADVGLVRRSRLQVLVAEWWGVLAAATKRGRRDYKGMPGSVEPGPLTGLTASRIHKAMSGFTFGRLETSLEQKNVRIIS